MTKPTLITYNGKTATAKEWAAELGVSPLAIKRRFHRHGTPYPKERKLTISRIANEHNIPSYTIYGRMRNGMTLEKALTHPKYSSHKFDTVNIVEIDGVIHTKQEWAKLNGVSRALLSFRLKKGWTLKEAVSTPPKPRHKRQ